ncbi:MAG: hypothetical protein WA782_14230 [Sulfitobacter sp.]
MSELAHTTDELKGLLKVARKQPVSFGLNLGKQDGEHYFLLDRRKKPEMLGRTAKADGPGNKFAFGTAEIDGKILNLTCAKVIPAIAKKLKRFLKTQKISLNVQILDADGTVLDADIEQLPEDVADDEKDLAQAEAPADDLAPLQARFAALHGRFEEMENADVLIGPFARVQALLSEGNALASTAGMDKLEAAMAKISGAASTSAAANSGAQDMGALKDRFMALKTEVSAVEAKPVQAKLVEALKAAAGQLKQGQLEACGNMLGKIEAALAKLGAVPQAPDAPPPPPASGSAEPANPAKADAQKRLGDLRGSIGKLKEMDPELAQTLRGDLAAFQKFMSDGAFEEAADLMDDIELELASMLPPSNVNFQKLRLRWIDAKKAAGSDIANLRSALLAEFDDPESTQSADRLDEVLGNFNEGLADTLDDFNNSEQGDVRTGHKTQARKIVTKYISFLESSPLVNHVENNPFVSVPLRVTLTQPLMLLDAELAKAGA